MSWDLEADVDLSGDGFSLIVAFSEALVPDIKRVTFEVTRGDWPIEVLAKESYVWDSDTLKVLKRLCANGPVDDQTIHIMFTMCGEYDNWDYAPWPEVYLSGPRDYDANYRRRRRDAMLYFGNRKAFQGNNTLASGRILDEAFVIQVLEQVCRRVQPQALYLLNEESVSIPLNYHFVFHRTLAGYASDIAEIVQVMLHGGKTFQDGRRNYEQALFAERTMLFCKRGGEYLAFIKQFLAVLAPQLEERGVPDDLNLNLVGDALLACEDLDFFFTPNDGLGIYSKPLLSTYCENLYLEIMYRLNNESLSS